MSRPSSSSALLTGRMGRPMRFHIVFALERLPAHVTLVGLVVAVALDVLAEVLGLVELGAAQVALVALQQLLVGFLVELEVELALEHRRAEDAGVVPRALGTIECFGSGLGLDQVRSGSFSRIRIQEGKNDHKSRKNLRNFMFFEVLDVK
jgi:hypothetical protein